MKKLLLVLSMMCMLICGCSSGGDEAESTMAFTLPAEKQSQYLQEINDTLNNFYWKYDENSILFFSEKLPSVSQNEEIYNAGSKAGFEFTNQAGKSAVVGTVNLLHFNGDKAGIGYFYFIKDKIQGAYYTSEDTKKVCSLTSRNVFKKSVDFKGYETDSPIAEFKSTRVSFPEEGFVSSTMEDNGNKKLLSVAENSVRVYRYSNYMSLMRTLSFKDDLVPISATFYDGAKIAVLLGRNIYSEGEDEREVTGTTSEKIVFYDEKYSSAGEIELGSSGYSCVFYINGQLVLFRDNNVEFYNIKDGEFELDNQIFMKHRVTSVKVSDIDGDGADEYIMTDGMDLYLYQKNDVAFVCLWQTHLGIKSLTGNIYTGDLNRDGAKEMYICDTTGTVIRYILTENGLVSSNDDIIYGQKIFAEDFDNDGNDDYLEFIMGDTKYSVTLNMAVK